MTKIIKIVLSISILFSAHSVLACDYPGRALIPNGSTATKDEMVEGRRAIQKYVADMETYLECIVAEEKAARDELGNLEPAQEQEREDMLNKKYNAAVDEMERLAAQFNSELKAYNAKQDS